MKKGFTLLEVIIVVLIVAVLAAIAVPQYQKAVEKSKAMQAIVLLNSINQELQLYYLRNGQYPSNLNELDITLPAWTGNQKWLGSSSVLSNSDWSLEYGGIQNGQKGLSIGRIAGSYAGAGFVIYTYLQGQGELQKQVGKMLCFETNKYATISFIGSGRTYGDYCQKLFHGRLVTGMTSGRWYLIS